ncbi:hypothetical protein ACKC9G_10830 [Pokkaliibacter sp. CJK22405]|uniref:hypothetical protein n=1 Tax=Pokkaliibacter sp. CJK22405 TaxID=3384615 RepID=UPI0039855698
MTLDFLHRPVIRLTVASIVFAALSLFAVDIRAAQPAGPAMTIEELDSMPVLSGTPGSLRAEYSDNNHNGLWDGVERKIRLNWHGEERAREREFLLGVGKLYEAVAIAPKSDNIKLGYLEQINQLTACMLKEPGVNRDAVLQDVQSVRGWTLSQQAHFEEYVRVKNTQSPEGVRKDLCVGMYAYFADNFYPYPSPVPDLGPTASGPITPEALSKKEYERQHRYSSPAELSSF